MEEMDLKHYRRLPETVWLVNSLKEHFNLNNPETWQTAGSWDRINQLKGQMQFLAYLEALLNEA